MRKIILILLVILSMSTGYAQIKPLQPGNIVAFKIKNAGMKVDGSFSSLKGTILFDPGKPSTASFEIIIDARTIATGINGRDNHLRKQEYFDTEQYPEIRFKSKKTEATKTGFIVTGDLFVKGTTKEINIPFSYTENEKGGIFSATFTLNRLDFGVGSSSWVLSDDVTVLLNINVLAQ